MLRIVHKFIQVFIQIFCICFNKAKAITFAWELLTFICDCGEKIFMSEMRNSMNDDWAFGSSLSGCGYFCYSVFQISFSLHFSANIHQRKFISAVPFLISISLSTLSNVRFQLQQPACHVYCGRGSNSFTKSTNYFVKHRLRICEGFGHPKYTGCCKTSVKLCKPFCDAFWGVILLLLCSFDCQIWAIFHFGTLWL